MTGSDKFDLNAHETDTFTASGSSPASTDPNPDGTMPSDGVTFDAKSDTGAGVTDGGDESVINADGTPDDNNFNTSVGTTDTTDLSGTLRTDSYSSVILNDTGSDWNTFSDTETLGQTASGPPLFSSFGTSTTDAQANANAANTAPNVPVPAGYDSGGTSSNEGTVDTWNDSVSATLGTDGTPTSVGFSQNDTSGDWVNDTGSKTLHEKPSNGTIDDSPGGSVNAWDSSTINASGGVSFDALGNVTGGGTTFSDEVSGDDKKSFSDSGNDNLTGGGGSQTDNYSGSGSSDAHYDVTDSGGYSLDPPPGYYDSWMLNHTLNGGPPGPPPPYVPVLDGSDTLTIDAGATDNYNETDTLVVTPSNGPSDTITDTLKGKDSTTTSGSITTTETAGVGSETGDVKASGTDSFNGDLSDASKDFNDDEENTWSDEVTISGDPSSPTTTETTSDNPTSTIKGSLPAAVGVSGSGTTSSSASEAIGGSQAASAPAPTPPANPVPAGNPAPGGSAGTEETPWYNNDWSDWINPYAWGASRLNSYAERIGNGYADLLVTNHKLDQQIYMNRQSDLFRQMENPSDPLNPQLPTVDQSSQAQRSLMGLELSNAGSVALSTVDALLAQAELVADILTAVEGAAAVTGATRFALRSAIKSSIPIAGASVVAPAAFDPFVGTASNAGFGRLIGWGTGAQGATARTASITAQEIQQAGITRQVAHHWLDFYRNAVAHGQGGAAAPERFRLMQRVLELLGGGG